jgi:hypothetical protein
VGATHANLKTAREIHPVEIKAKDKVKDKTLGREKVGSIHGFPPALLLLRH